MSAAAERLRPWLLLLPALAFATPLSPLADDPYPHLAGTGIAVVLLAPLALFLLVSGSGARGAWPFVLALAWALVARALAPVTDTCEARRALLGLALLPLAFAGGAGLDARGRATFLGALVVLSLAWTGWALARGFAGEEFAGVLGDTGSLSQAALPGAAVAGAWLAREDGAKRVLGAFALFLFLVHVAAAPVITGSHTLLAGLLCAAWRGPARGRGALLVLALTALLAPFAGMAAREALHARVPALEGASEAPSHSLAGLGVRALVWKSALGLVADHPFTGAGPGQFQAAFPPYRDAREIELSRHGACSELDTEVEHAHNDWLQGFCELGLPGGLLLTLGLALAARAALRACGDDERLPAALASLALLVNAFVHAPLSSNSAAAPLALALFGSLAPEGPRSRVRALACALPALCALPFAPALVTHGGALADYIRSARALDALSHATGTRAELAARVSAEAARARAIVQVALAAAPDSVPARELAARALEPGRRLEAWEGVLALRPHSAGAWEETAAECVRAGRFEDARARYLRALELSPTHPRLLKNLARLECTRLDFARGLETIERLRAQGCLAPDWLAELGRALALEFGRPEGAAQLLFGRSLASLSPEELHARARGEASDGEAYECLAQLLWARQHAAAGEFELALRNYRQAAERSRAKRGAEAGAAPPYALELAAAELRAGRRDDALAHARGLALAADARAALPDWARAALPELGLPARGGS